MSDRPDYVREIRSSLTDPRRLCDALGVDLRDHKRQANGGLIVRCPIREERSPSCSITRGPDHTVRFKCFGCDATGDALDLIAEVRGIPQTSFLELLAEAADVAGLSSVADEIRSGRPAPDRPPVKPLPPPEPPKPYPPSDEVRAIWDSAAAAPDDRDTSRYLVGRRIDPVAVHARGLGRVVRDPLPPWACYGSRTWLETGHRLVCRVFDAAGHGRSVRACRVVDGDTPKRLPPKGYRASELVLVNKAAWQMLRGASTTRVLVAEGEPDFLTLATVQPETVAVLGIASGSWTNRFAEAVPHGVDVVVFTDPDEAGERYAAKIFESLGERCRTWRAA